MTEPIDTTGAPGGGVPVAPLSDPERQELAKLRDAALEKDRELYVAQATKSQEEFDKLVLTLSSGALVLSVGFIEKVVPLAEASCKPLLVLSWILFIVSMGGSLFSHIASVIAHDRETERLDKYRNGVTDLSKNPWIQRTKQANWVAMGVLGLGVGLLVAFAGVNILLVAPPKPPPPPICCVLNPTASGQPHTHGNETTPTPTPTPAGRREEEGRSSAAAEAPAAEVKVDMATDSPDASSTPPRPTTFVGDANKGRAPSPRPRPGPKVTPSSPPATPPKEVSGFN